MQDNEPAKGFFRGEAIPSERARSFLPNRAIGRERGAWSAEEGFGASATSKSDETDLELKLLLKESYWDKLRECLRVSLHEVDLRMEHHRHLAESFMRQMMEEQQRSAFQSTGEAEGQNMMFHRHQPDKSAMLRHGRSCDSVYSIDSDCGRSMSIILDHCDSASTCFMGETSASNTPRPLTPRFQLDNVPLFEEDSEDDDEASQKSEENQDRPTLKRSNTVEFFDDEEDRWKNMKKAISQKRQQTKGRHKSIRKVLKRLGSGKTVTAPDTRIARIALSTPFSIICSFLILMNVIFIGYGTEVGVKQSFKSPPEDDPEYFRLVNRCFAIAFMLEVSFRIVALRGTFFLGTDWQWNLFDLGLVATSMIEEMLNMLNLTFFRALRVLRMVRALRMIRVLRFFRELRTMVCSILHTLSSLAWALILLLLIMYLFSIVFMQATASYVRDRASDDPTAKELKRWYTTIMGTIYSLFLAISGGNDWYELQKPLGQISWVYSTFFAVYIFFVVFGVLNVLIGVFVERASESSKLDRDLMIHSEQRAADSFLQEMHEIFNEIPKDSYGMVTRETFNKYIQDDRVKAYFNTRHLDVAAHRLFQVLEGYGGERKVSLDVDDFVSGMMRLQGNAKNADIVMLLSDSLRIHKKLSHIMQTVNMQLKALNARSNRNPPEPKARSRGVDASPKADTAIDIDFVILSEKASIDAEHDVEECFPRPTYWSSHTSPTVADSKESL